MRFEDVDSRRLRVGGRLTLTAGERARPYLGAAWEREFDGAADASIMGHPIEAPTLKGDTAVGELGLSIALTEGGRATLDAGVRGYAGKAKGFGGNLTLRFDF